MKQLYCLAAASLAALGCAKSSSSITQSITNVPFQVFPLLANPGASFTLSVTGRFTGKDGDRATIALTRTRSLDGTPDSTVLTSATAVLGTENTVRQLTLPLALLADAPIGIYRVDIAGPPNVALEDAFVILPKVTLASLPQAVCAPPLGTASFAVGIDDYYDTGPEPVALSATLAGAPVAVTADDCINIPLAQGVLRKCSTARFVATPSSSGVAQLVITTPSDLSRVQETLAQRIFVDRPPSVQTLPDIAYSTADAPAPASMIPQFAASFHEAALSPPHAFLDGAPAEVSMDGCQDSELPGHLLCAGATVTLPRGTPAGTHQLSLNTMPGCTAQTDVTVLDPPRLDAVQGTFAASSPTVVCGNQSFPEATLEGANFHQPKLFVDGTEVFAPAPCSGQASRTCGLMQAVLRLPSTGAFVAPGQHTLTVANATIPPLSRSFPFTVEIPATVTPLAPQLLNNGLERQIFVPVQNAHGSLLSAALSFGQVTMAPKSFAAVAGGALLTVPAGMAEGTWNVLLTDESACFIGPGGFFETPGFDIGDPGFGASTVPVEWTPADAAPPAVAEHVPHGTAGAVHFAAPAGSPAWSLVYIRNVSADLGTMLFDFRRSGTGTPVDGPDLTASGNGYTLEYTLSPAPQDAWTSYSVPLDAPDGWTLRAADGSSRAATEAEVHAVFRDAFRLKLRGSAFDGDTDASFSSTDLLLVH